MNELLLLIPSPFMSSIDCNGKMAVTSHLSSKEAVFSWVRLFHFSEETYRETHRLMGMCALYCITVSKNCNVRDAAEKAAVVKGLFPRGVFFFSLRKEMIKPIGLRFHQIQ